MFGKNMKEQMDCKQLQIVVGLQKSFNNFGDIMTSKYVDH